MSADWSISGPQAGDAVLRNVSGPDRLRRVLSARFAGRDAREFPDPEVIEISIELPPPLPGGQDPESWPRLAE